MKPLSTQSATPNSTSKNLASSPATSTTLPVAAPSSSIQPFPACGCGLLPYDCPSVDQNHYNSTISSQSATYKYLCNVDFGAYVQPGGPSIDISIKNTSTVQECMDACTSWNLPSSTPCLGITFHANLTFIIGARKEHGNCFLKDNVSSPNPFRVTRYGMSALLLT